jgi:hypothetical protein
MADWPTYSTDAAICRLLAGGPLPTASVAEQLAMPVRSARYRLAQLRRDGVVAVGADGLYHLAALAAPDLAAPTDRSTTDGGLQAAIGAVAVVVAGLAALVLIGRRRGALAVPPIRYDLPDDAWWPGW